jgi:hypothetical protein
MKPRKPYGPNPPGRLPATMIKVLAAELSDQGRLARGKRYWADDAVVDLVVGHGVVTAVIQGSRPEPYVVTIEAASGNGVPGKRDVWISCTCPDDGTATEACKHAVAALFALSDEVAIEPELVERWRAGSRARSRSAPPAEAESGLAEVVPIRQPDRATSTPPRPAPPPADPMLEELARLLAAPNGADAPEFPEVTPITHAGIRDRQLAEVLSDAIAHLEINWE